MKTRKRILLTAKLLIAVGLLGWVVSQAHWFDFVRLNEQAGGNTYTFLRALPAQDPPAVDVQTGWMTKQTKRVPVESLVPIETVPAKASLRQRFVRRGFVSTLRDIQPVLFTAGVLCFPLSLIILSVRWWLLLRIQGIYLGLWETIRLTFLGHFFNYVVPGTVGGDVVKAWYTAKHTPRVAAVLVSMFVDRILGLLQLTFLATVMLVVVLAMKWESLDRMKPSLITVASLAVLITVGSSLLFSRRLKRWLHVEWILNKLPIARHIDAANTAIRLYRRKFGTMAQAITATIGTHILLVLGIALMGMSLRLEVPMYRYFVYVPLIYILGAIPITPGGVGLMEKLYVSFFAVGGLTGGVAGVGPSEAVALAMLGRIMPMLWGLPGVYVAITGPRMPKVEQMQHDLEEAELAEQHSPPSARSAVESGQ